MRYMFNVVVHNGVAEIISESGPLPDGSWQVGGNEDDFGAGINVVHRLPSGKFTAEAQHFSTYYNYDPTKFIQLPAEQWTEDGGESIPVGPSAPADGLSTTHVAHQPPEPKFRNSDVIETAAPPLPRRHPHGSINHADIGVDPDC